MPMERITGLTHFKTLQVGLASLLLGLAMMMPMVRAQETEFSIDAFREDLLPSEDVIDLRQYIDRPDNYPIDISTVIKLIEDQNLPLAQGRVDVQIAKTGVWQKAVVLLPNIDGVYSQSRFKGGTQVFGGETFEVVRTTVQPQLGASWTINPAGKQIYDILAAKRRRDASQFLLTQTMQEQLSNGLQEYYSLLLAYLQRQIVMRAIAEAEAQLTLNDALYKSGKGLKLDVMRSRSTLAQQKTQLTEAETAIVKAEQTLLVRLNLSTEVHLLPNFTEAHQKTLVSPEAPVESLLTQAVENNPTLSKTDEDLKALGIDLKSLRASLIPSITLRTYTNQTGANWNSLVRSDFTGITVQANLLESLGFKIPLDMKQKRNEIERKILERQTQVRTIESEVTGLFLSGKNLEAAIESAKEEYAAAAEAYRLAFGRYQAGYGAYIDVIQSQTALITARGNVVTAILNYNQNQVQLVEAMGKADPATLMNGVSLNAATNTP